MNPSSELTYNSYFYVLQENFRHKYEEARANCWVFCIPTSEALRGLDIDEKFVDIHILRPIDEKSVRGNSLYCSSAAEVPLIYEFCKDKLILNFNNENEEGSKTYCINVISEDIGYNTMFQPYKVMIVDKILNPGILTSNIDEKPWENLTKNILSHYSAVDFLQTFYPDKIRGMQESLKDLGPLVLSSLGVTDACQLLHQTVLSLWSALLPVLPQHQQRDARFQSLLSTALETLVIKNVHQEVFSVISETFAVEDTEIFEHCSRLANIGVSSDQLGVPEDFAVQLPAAVVELAAIDSLKCPIEKLACLHTCLDLVRAQVKAALVDFQSISNSDGDEAKICQVEYEELIPLLTTVIVHAKPLHIFSSIYYMENLQWTLTPNDPLSCSLSVFKAALGKLRSVHPEKLLPRNRKVHRELALQDLIMVTDELVQPDRKVSSTLDRQLESITTMIEKSTRDGQSKF